MPIKRPKRSFGDGKAREQKIIKKRTEGIVNLLMRIDLAKADIKLDPNFEGTSIEMYRVYISGREVFSIQKDGNYYGVIVHSPDKKVDTVSGEAVKPLFDKVKKAAKSRSEPDLEKWLKDADALEK